jgi:microcystin-dependent protein
MAISLAANIKGPKGDKGDTGADSTVPGPPGSTGPSGPSGPTGPAGSTGSQGPQGVKGDPGATGATGSPGAPGDSDPVGTILMWGTTTAPAGWLLCDGSLVSRTAFPALFSLLGTTFGAGDGSTTFGLPDLRGRTGIGAGTGTGLSSRILGVNGGEESHQLSIAELASHTHVQNAHNHNAFYAVGATSGSGANVPGGSTTALATTSTTAVNQSTGSDGAHNNMPPFLVVCYIIKASLGGGPTAQAPLADPTRDGLLRKVSGLTTDFVDGTNNCQPLAPVIWSARLRSFNAIGNCNFECDQRLLGSGTGAVPLCDRWYRLGVPTAPVITTQPISAPAVIPGTSYRITNRALQFTLTTAGSVPTNQFWGVLQYVEGSQLRALFQDVTSISILAASSVPSFSFPVILSNGVSGSSGWVIGYLCTTSATPNTPTLITIPNIPVWNGTEGTEWYTTPGQMGYQIRISLCAAASSSLATSVIGQWIRPTGGGNIWGVQNQTNFGAQTVGSTFTLYFVQHEPGSLCTTLIDKPFTQNLDEALRYYQKTYNYGTAVGSTSNSGGANMFVQQSATAQNPTGPISFKKTMAKIPTLIPYSVVTGAANTVRDASSGGIDRAVTSILQLGDSGYGGCGLGSYSSTAASYSWHHTADTGW